MKKLLLSENFRIALAIITLITFLISEFMIGSVLWVVTFVLIILGTIIDVIYKQISLLSLDGVLILAMVLDKLL